METRHHLDASVVATIFCSVYQLLFKTAKRRMKLREKTLIQKYYLSVFNGIFLALGLMFLTFGLWLLLDRNNLFSVLFSSGENQLVTYISCILLGIGSVITFTSAMGFLGSVVEIKCLLVTYIVFQILVFVTQMAILVLIIMKKEEVHNQWNNRIDEVISEYGNESLAEQEPVWNILNAMQSNMKCCGRYNATQWERNKNKRNSTQIPCSCTKSNLKKWFCDVSRDSTYSMGCEEYLNTWFENNVLILIAITISLLVTQISSYFYGCGPKGLTGGHTASLHQSRGFGLCLQTHGLIILFYIFCIVILKSQIFLVTFTHRLFRNITKNNIWPNES